MNIDVKKTVTELEAATNLVQDKCSHPKCGVTILVDRNDKIHGRKSLCTSCLMRQKLSNGSVK